TIQIDPGDLKIKFVSNDAILREWRKFTFFDLKKGVDHGKISDALKDVDITVTTSGNNQLILGDSKGLIYLISRSWNITSFKAYAIKVYLAYQLRNLPLLVTVGDDEQGINPVIKVWDTSQCEKSETPFCSRVTRAIPNSRAVQANAICVHENLQLLAVGFVDGSLMLYRGDITRDRTSRSKLLKDSGSPITGLAFKTMSTATLLFVATDVSVSAYNITLKDKEHKIHLDNIGCAKQCSVLAESVQESHFVIASNNAVYFYTSDGKGPCYAVDGEKVILEWFRSYLVIISKINRPSSISSANSESQNVTQSHMVTVLDIQNKFIIFSATMNDVKAVFNEWGAFYILDSDYNVYHLDEKDQFIIFSATMNDVKAVFNEWGAFYILDSDYNVYHLDEKDLQTKLSLLFKKNLYDVAIRIAKSEQYDLDGLVDIFQQYGDHLYSKGAYCSAIEQYIKTIGKLEPSYVIRKFVDSQHIELLTTYLQAIHKQGHANEDHTTLLLNCFTKLNKNDSLKDFILMKDHDLDFNVDIAIKVCRQGSPQEALMLARKHQKHDWYIKLLLEDHSKYTEAVEYIGTLKFNDAELYMRKYGSILIQHAPHESTQFLRKLCTNYRPSTQSKNDTVEPVQKADPEDYIHLFLNNSARLVEFLEHLIKEECYLSAPVYDTLLEHYLHVWDSFIDGPDKAKYSHKILKLLQNSDSKYDKPQALVVCHMHGFSSGILYLYEEQKLYQQILRYHMSQDDSISVLSCCRRYGQQEPTLWIHALFYCVNSKNPPMDILPDILSVIAKEQLLSPQLVIDAIEIGRSNISLGHISSYILSELKKEQDIINNDSELTYKYRKDIDSLKEQLETLKHGTIVIQGSRCAACNHPLELPSVHFLCQHSYHQHCFQSYSENEKECPACQPENKKLVELLKAREYTKDLNETFHSELDKRSDGVSLAAEYFGRGVFNKVKVIEDLAIDKTLSIYNKKEQQKHQPEKQIPAYGLGAEARIRQVENARSMQAVKPTSEGRMRVQESQIMSTSYDSSAVTVLPKKIETSKTTNPFEDEYDDTLNPFNKYDEARNPFSEEYDKNLNQYAA
ncbi:hypothetical protein AMK59_5836, partial [Oryctes borbonicus]